MHYKDQSNALYFLEDDSFSYLLPTGCIQITDAEAEALKPTPIPAPIAPLTPRQIRMALSRAGLRTTVEAAVTAGNQDLKDWWEWSQTFERLHPEVVAMGAALGQTDAAMDALWALGVTL